MGEKTTVQEIIIVGWGLAGAALGWELYFREQSFSVKDSLENHSTRVAAGLVNPVVFKRLTKSWNADVLMPYADDFYTRIEEILGLKLVSRKSIFRVFASVEEANNWASKEGDDRFSPYLTSPSKAELPAESAVQFPNGIGEVKTIGNLDTVKFLEASKEFFLAKEVQFDTGFFDETELNPTKTYIFSEGYGLRKNPFFKYLPLNLTHGETLLIETKELNFDATLNKNMFVMQVAPSIYKVGATYNWELTEPVTTAAAKNELIERLESFTSFPYTIIEHKAGIRPTVIDRKPLLGVHPAQKNAFVFNGLGTKGVMIAPYYAGHLLDHILKDESLEREVDIQRFEHYYLPIRK